MDLKNLQDFEYEACEQEADVVLTRLAELLAAYQQQDRRGPGTALLIVEDVSREIILAMERAWSRTAEERKRRRGER